MGKAMASRDAGADVRSALALAPSAKSVVEKLGERVFEQDGAKASIQFAKHRGRWIAEFRFFIRSGSHQACTLPLTTSSERCATRAAALAGAASRLLESLQSAIEGERLAKAGQKAVAALRAWAGQFLAAEPEAQVASGPLSGMRFLDVFAGIGGFHQALASLGASCAGAIELDAKARETYKANHRGDYPVHADIREVDAGAFGKVHIVCGGFPCQSFSLAGKRAGFGDPDKGALFFDLARLLGALSPSIAILENVAGLANHDGGRTLDIVFDTLTRLGYSVSMRMLNSGSFGTPQMRERLFLVCIHDRVLANRTAPFVFPKGADMASVVADILELNPEVTPCGRAWERTKPDPTARSGKIETVGLIDGKKGQGYRIASPLGKGFTLCANSGGAGGKTGLYLVDGKPRALTPREAARMQGFPDEFEPHALRSVALRQFGNSVAVPVVEAIANALTFKRSAPRGPLVDPARKPVDEMPVLPVGPAGVDAPAAEFEGAQQPDAGGVVRVDDASQRLGAKLGKRDLGQHGGDGPAKPASQKSLADHNFQLPVASPLCSGNGGAPGHFAIELDDPATERVRGKRRDPVGLAPLRQCEECLDLGIELDLRDGGGVGAGSRPKKKAGTLQGKLDGHARARNCDVQVYAAKSRRHRSPHLPESAPSTKRENKPKRKAPSQMKADSVVSMDTGVPNYSFWVKGFTQIRNEPQAAFQKINLRCDFRFRTTPRSFLELGDSPSMIESLSIAKPVA